MTRSNNIWRRLLASLVVAVGVAVLWGLAATWIGTLIALISSRRNQIIENIEVASDGTPVIGVQMQTTYNPTYLSRRTLDGKPWPNEYEDWLYPAFLEGRQKPPGLIDFPVTWNQYEGRIFGQADGKRPPSVWFAVRDAAPVGHVYYIGYDVLSKLPIGYIGTQGFRETLPDRAEQFTIPPNRSSPLHQFITTTGMRESDRIPFYYELPTGERISPWLDFLVDGERLWEIDLRTRAVRELFASPEMLSAGDTRTLEATLLNSLANNAAARSRDAIFPQAADVKDPGQVSKAVTLTEPATPIAKPEAERPKMSQTLVIRTSDRILLYDPPTEHKLEFKLPADIHDDQLRIYWIAPDQLLITYSNSYWENGPITHLLWVKPDGSVTRQEELKLHGWLAPSPRTDAWKLAAVAPVPVAWFASVFAINPLTLIQDNKADNYSSAVRQTFEVTGVPLLLVLALSVLSAWIVGRLQRHYSRSHSGIWCAFTFLLGIPGLLAYWFEHRRAKLESCAECGQTVPRDRDSCAACNSPFSAPPLMGTEIFA